MNRRRLWVAAQVATIVLVYSCDRVDPPTQSSISAPSAPNAATSVATAGQLGAWSAPLSWPIVAAHSSVLPDGRVLTWVSSDVPGDGEQHSVWAWTPETGVFAEYTNGSHNVFCAAQVFLSDGRLLVAGGHISDNKGVKDAAIFNYLTNLWDPAANMRTGRWYPTMTLLVNGQVSIVAGSDENASGNTLAEVWDGSGWKTLNGASLNLPYYPWMHSAPDGRVFMSGPEATARYLNPSGAGEWTVAAKSTGGFREFGGSVMYAPGKILIMGGGDPPTNSAETIDLNTGGGWTPTGSMQFRRRQMNSTVLPDGRVLAIGGTQGATFNDESQRVLPAEVWDPSTGVWTTLASMQIGRQYHSSAVLLPDARILVAGGGRCAACLVDHRDAELFSPPYLYTADGSPAVRPVVSSAPTSVAYGQSFAVSTPDAATIARVTWVRLPSTTHSFNQNQWFNELSFSRGSGVLNVTAPPNAYKAPPGHYMLYILNGSGVPSVAKIVQVTGSAALPPAPGIPAAPSGLTPLDQTIALSWVDNSTSETAFHIERCQGATCSDFAEVGSVGPNVSRYSDATVTAGVTYRYRVRAENGAGFSAYSNAATATASAGPAALPIVNRLSGRCVDVQWAGRAPGTPVVIWDCQQQVPNQSFALQSIGVPGPIQVYGSMCLDVVGGTGTDGAGVVIQTCNGAASQVWTQTAANQLRGINGKCIDLTSAGTANGTLLVLAPCASTANQQWKSVTGSDSPATPIITSSCTGLGCTFDSSGSTDDVGIVSRSWDFGDGTTAGNLISAVKEYKAAGTYVVTLGITDDSWQTARERASITVSAQSAPNNPPVAAFTQTCTGLTCAFTDGSTDSDGSIASRSWTFGDGATSSQTNPSRTYAAAGTYTVTLTVTDDDGAPTTVSKSVAVSAPPTPNNPPVAAFTQTCTGLTCAFTDGSTDSDGSIASRSWTFGDGATSSQTNPSRTYAAAGTYTVTLTVTDDDGAPTTVSKAITVSAPPAATALPIVNRLSGRCVDVQWAGRAPGTPVVIWDCQQQVPNQSFALQSIGVSGPIQVYGSMCLDVVGGTGTDGAGVVIQTCNGAASQVWTQTAANQLRGINGKCIDLTSAGTANGTLLVLAPCASTANQQWKSVTGGDSPATAIITSSCAGLRCTFDSSGSSDDVGIVSRSWDFGDGTTAGNLISTVKDYQAAGTYVVTLGVTDASWQTARERATVTVSASTPISLTATPAKVNNIQQVTLRWSGAAGTSVQVRRTGTTSATFNTPNDGQQVDNLNRTGTGSYTYQVCEVGTSRCSAKVTAVFN